MANCQQDRMAPASFPLDVSGSFSAWQKLTLDRFPISLDFLHPMLLKIIHSPLESLHFASFQLATSTTLISITSASAPTDLLPKAGQL